MYPVSKIEATIRFELMNKGFAVLRNNLASRSFALNYLGFISHPKTLSSHILRPFDRVVFFVRVLLDAISLYRGRYGESEALGRYAP